MSKPEAPHESDLPSVALRVLVEQGAINADFSYALPPEVNPAALSGGHERRGLVDFSNVLLPRRKKLFGLVPGWRIHVRTPERNTIAVRVGEGETIKELKVAIEKKIGIPLHRQRLFCQGYELHNCYPLRRYALRDNCLVDLNVVCAWLEQQRSDPEFDRDYTHMKDEGESYYRGKEVYTRPYGWKRYALKVRGKYSSEEWLGEPGHRQHSSDGEWPVSYHGTTREGGEGISENGFLLCRGKRMLFGTGIYSTPNPKIAEKYAISFKHEGKDYKVMLQNRYDPNDTDVIEGVNYLVTKTEMSIRPYGFLVREA